MLPTTAAYRSALPYQHGRATFVRVFHGEDEVTPTGGLPFSTGQVIASLNARVTRTLDLTVASDWYPALTTDLLAPERARLQVLTGIQYSTGLQEMFPVFTGRVANVTQGPDGSVLLRGDDLASDVINQRFETPQSTIAGTSTIAEIRRFITQVLPTVQFADEDVDDQPSPQLTWDDDRGRALDNLASSVQGRWYFLGDGRATTRRLPYADSPALLRMADGEPDNNGGGLLLTRERSRSRDGAANSVTVISERISDGTSVEVTARDMTATSPTYYNGLYGRVTATLRPQTPLSAAGAGALARETLRATTALGDQWTVDVVPDASLEPGDVYRFEYKGAQTKQVADRIVYPLGTGGRMTLTCRSVSDIEVSLV